jgi:lipoprotein-anchoring transpeptidase ErfK/SrfK
MSINVAIPRVYPQLAFVALILAGAPAVAAEDEPAPSVEEEFPILMRTKGVAPVHRTAHRRTQVVAKVYPGAVLQVARRWGGGGCPSGWYEREGGGFVCSKYLGRTDETEPRPALNDQPQILDGAYGVLVTRSGPRLYRNLRDIPRRRVFITLWQGAILKVRNTLTRYGVELYETRQGWFAESRRTERLPEPIVSLGVEVSAERPAPGAIVVSDEAVVMDQPGFDGVEVERLERWATVPATGEGPLIAEQGWVALGQGRYVNEDDLAQVRPAPRPRHLDPDERWIAVDLEEQLLHAYQGERLVRVVPCSTGKGGNTRRGTYRIQWKRRMQTMRLKLGHVRVEDVQYVMYYDRKRSIAIHTAYWHRRFGRPASHGCVNVPRDDARWLFDWSSPHSLPEDSERFPTRKEPGSQVIVF